MSNNTFNAAQSGTGNKTVTYTYTNANGCSASSTKSITVLANPTMSIQGGNEIVWGENKVLTVPSGFSSYQWYKNGSAISGANNRSYSVNNPGTYYVRITAASGASLNVSPANIINKASLQNENFIQTISYKVPRKEDETVSTIGEVMEQFTYYDGLGRPMQTLQTQASPNRRDMIKPVEYDELGRISKEYLPYASNKSDGVFEPTALRSADGNYEASNQFNFYSGMESDVAVTDFPYTEIAYEPSPLNRPIAQFAQGEEWAKEQGNVPVSTDYLISTTADNVKKFSMDGVQLVKNAPYGNGAFEKLLITDENGHQSATFTDAFGKTLLKRNYGEGTEQFDTYYVYDIYDNLRFVIPPEAARQITGTSGAVDTNLLEQFVFQYRYDGRNRMIWKKVPGAKPVIMIYDDRDRLVLTQDAEQLKDSEYSFTKYDALNRPIMSGVVEITDDLAIIRDKLKGDAWQQNYDAFETLEGTRFGYTNTSYPPINEVDIYTVTYYDNYDFRAPAQLDASSYNYASNGVANEFAQSNFVKGQVTGSLTRILGTTEMLGSINYYDERYRIVQNISQQPNGKIINTNNGYDFIGNLLQSKTHYDMGQDSHTLTESFTYDHADRLVQMHHELAIPVIWEFFSNMELTNNELKKITTGYNWNAQAYTSPIILANQNGSISFKALNRSDYRMIGLAKENTVESWQSIDYAIYLRTNGDLQIREKGSGNKLSGANYQTGDVFKVERVGNKVNYWQNGSLLRSVNVNSDSPLIADLALYSANAKIEDVYVSRQGQQLMVSNQYNELGELITKNLHEKGGNFAQSVDYRYNIRGWLERINHADLNADNPTDAPDLYGMELGYTDNLETGAQPQFNGNIAAIKWSNNLGLGEDLAQHGINVVNQRSYGFKYDPLNRIEEANSFERINSLTSTNNYSMSVSEYDFNGNIKNLERKDGSGAAMDNLEYFYGASNQLQWVKDHSINEEGFNDGNPSGIDYTYDDNGNMISDANKEIDTIRYNYLNLPKEVIFANGNQIRYIYDAAGIKHRQEVYENNSLIKATDYIGAMIMENDTLQFIQTAEGRVVPKDNAWAYEYHLKDHLGNVRTTFTANPETELFTTSFETTEQPMFDNYQDQNRDMAYKRTGSYSSRLSSEDNQLIGLAKSMKVYPGDTVSAEVYVRQLEGTNGNVNNLFSLLASGFSSAFAGSMAGLEGNLNTVSEFIYPPSGTGGIHDEEDENAPKLYLNLLYFDKDMTYITSSYHQSSNASKTGFERLFLDDVLVLQEGYMFIYVSNQEEQANIAYFDDIEIEHNHSPVLQEQSYYPFGLQFSNGYRRTSSKENRYTYNGKESITDLDLGWLDFGARMYQADLGRWFNIDPMSEERNWLTPYNFVQNNPIIRIDPTGMLDEWIPDSEGNLIAEAGDNAQTLADYQGISYEEGLKQLTDQGYNVDKNGIVDLKVGDKVELDNVFTQSIENSTGEFSTDVMMGLAPPPEGSGPGFTSGTPEDNYNCWGSACAGSQGKTIDNTVGIALPSTFDSKLTNDYTPTTSANASFGKTVLRFADKGNNTQHGAVFYGRSNNGTTYIYSKNGWHAKPEVMKLTDLKTKIPSYGTVQGLTTGTSGYYNPNMP